MEICPKDTISSYRFIQIFIGLVFVAAGSMRYFIPNRRKIELENMKLDKIPHLQYLIMMMEIIIGFAHIINYEKHKNMTLFLAMSLVLSIVLMTLCNLDKVKESFLDLFTFHPNCISIILHITYLVLVIYILYPSCIPNLVKI